VSNAFLNDITELISWLSVGICQNMMQCYIWSLYRVTIERASFPWSYRALTRPFSGRSWLCRTDLSATDGLTMITQRRSFIDVNMR